MESSKLVSAEKCRPILPEYRVIPQIVTELRVPAHKKASKTISRKIKFSFSSPSKKLEFSKKVQNLFFENLFAEILPF